MGCDYTHCPKAISVVPRAWLISSPFHTRIREDSQTTARENFGQGQVRVWSEDMQTAFEELKVKLTLAPVLSCPDYEKPFVINTDDSSRAVGAVLSQADENGEITPYIMLAKLYLQRNRITWRLRERH